MDEIGGGCGVVKRRGAGPKENESYQRISSCGSIYEELKFYSINNKVYIIFSFMSIRYLGKSAILYSVESKSFSCLLF